MKPPHDHLPPKPPAAKPTVITITKEQAELLAPLETNVQKAEAQLRAEVQVRNSCMFGIIAGHGLKNVQVTDFDAAKRTLTMVPLPAKG